MAQEININIKNIVETTNSNNPKTQGNNPKPVEKKKESSTKSDPKLLGIGVEQWTGTAIRLASAVGFDTGVISKLSHYGFAVGKAIAGIAMQDYKEVVQLAVEVSVSAIEAVRKEAQENAAAENSVDQARIQLGLMDISGYSAKVKKWSGRVTYNKLNGR